MALKTFDLVDKLNAVFPLRFIALKRIEQLHDDSLIVALGAANEEVCHFKYDENSGLAYAFHYEGSFTLCSNLVAAIERVLEGEE